jgi:hypothetical protein
MNPDTLKLANTSGLRCQLPNYDSEKLGANDMPQRDTTNKPYAAKE